MLILYFKNLLFLFLDDFKLRNCVYAYRLKKTKYVAAEFQLWLQIVSEIYGVLIDE